MQKRAGKVGSVTAWGDTLRRAVFPLADFVYELTLGEIEGMRSRILTTRLSSKSWGAPKAFMEKGLYMPVKILKSKRATLATSATIETEICGYGKDK